MTFLRIPLHSQITQYILAGALLMTTSASAGPLVERVSISPRSDGQGYVIRFHLDGPVSAYSEPREIGGNRVEMILFNAGLARGYDGDDLGGPIVAVSEDEKGGHVVFRFTLDSARPFVTSAYRDRGSDDVLLGLVHSADMPGSVADAAPTRLPTPVKRTSLEVGGAPEPDAPHNETVRRATAEGERWMLDTIVIDAGHGGRDVGAVANGVREKDVVLATALKLGEYIEENLGINVYYTRQDDRFIALKDRGKIANAQGGKLFISIHANAASNSRAHGTETFFLGTHKSDAARRTMELENSVVQFESDPDQYKTMDEESLIRMELTRSAYMRKSEEFAGLIERQFADRVGRTSRGVKQAGFYVLWGASMPAVLVELGFVTNKGESAFLRSESGQAYMASAIFRAVRDYKQQYEKGLSHVLSE